MDEKVIFEVDISSMAQNIATATADLNVLKRSYDEVKDSIPLEETIQWKSAIDAQTKSVKQSEGALLRLHQANKAIGGDINVLIKTYDATTKSVDQNRKVLNALTAQYNTLDAVAAQKLIPTIRGVSDVLKKQESAIGDNRRNVGNYTASILDAAGQLPVLGKAFQAVNGIAAANPFGAVVLVITQLFDILSRNKAVVDGLERLFSGASAAATEFAGALAGVGTSMSDAFGKEGNKIEGIGEKIKGVFITSFEGYTKFFKSLAKGEFKNAAKGFADGLTGVKDVVDKFNDAVDKIQNAGESGAAVKKLEQELRDETNATNIALSEREVTIAKLLKQSKDRSKSDEERISFLKQASALEKKRADEELKLAEQGVVVAKARAEADKHTDASEKAFADAQIRRNEALKNTVVVQEKITNDINALEQSLADARQQRLDAEKKVIEQHQKDVLDLQLQFGLSERERLENSFAEKQALLNASNEEELALINEIEIAKQRALKDYDKKKLDEIQKQEDEKNRIKEDARKKDLEAEKLAADQKNAIRESELSFATTLANGLVGLFETVARAQGVSAQFAKAMAAVQIAVSEAIAIANAVVAATSAGAETGVAAIGVVPAYLTTFIGITLANMAQAISLLAAPVPKTPSFAHGIIGLDGAGDETSDSIDAKLSKGESVMTAKATRKYHQQLAWMEMSVGNTPNYQFGHGKFATGFIPQIHNDGGLVSRETLYATNIGLDNISVIEAIKRLPAPKLSIVELENKQRSRNRSIKISEA